VKALRCRPLPTAMPVKALRCRPLPTVMPAKVPPTEPNSGPDGERFGLGRPLPDRVCLTPGNLTIGAAGSNWFIHSGGGGDAITLWGVSNPSGDGSGGADGGAGHPGPGNPRNEWPAADAEWHSYYEAPV
jgi:hypothetical protein